MKKRHLIYLCMIALVALPFIPMGGGTMGPVLPVVQLPGELIIRGESGLAQFFGGGLTNTFLATMLVWLLLFLFAFSLKAKSRSADAIPSGWYNFWEMVIEGAYGYVENSAGKWARNFFPFFMTFILLILVANWMELVPGVDSIGKWESMGELADHRAHASTDASHGDEADHGDEHATDEHATDDHATDDPGDMSMVGCEHAYNVEVCLDAMAADRGDLRRGMFLLRAPAETPEDADWTIVPFVRAAATDLNFTLALAIISVIMTQYYGMKALGLGYWKKFFAFDSDKIAKNPLGLMDTLVGILELVAEIAKILSFAFRLLGNIFAGQVLLFVMATLLPVANVAFFGLELFVGLIQAVVFALLTLTFMSGATHDHHADEH